MKPHEKPKHTFSALEDLERIKQLVVETPNLSVENVIKEARKTKAIASVKPVVKKSDEEKPCDIAKSVDRDDALVCKTLSKEKETIPLSIGDFLLFRRGVVMNKTHIPNIVWKRVFTHLGLQIVAKQYVTAIYAPVLASPAEEDGEAYTPDVILNHARQYLGAYNKKQKTCACNLRLLANHSRLEQAVTGSGC